MVMFMFMNISNHNELACREDLEFIKFNLGN